MKKALLGTAAGSPVEVWFQDEARVGQQGTHAYVWAPIGARPLMVRDNRHDSAYIFGAICPGRGVGAAMITPAANTEMMNLHLAEISTQVAASATAALICDGAGWHQTGGALSCQTTSFAAPATLQSRIEPDGERLGLSPAEQARQNKPGRTSSVRPPGTSTMLSSRPVKTPGTG